MYPLKWMRHIHGPIQAGIRSSISILRSDAQPKNKQKKMGEWGARKDAELYFPPIKTDRSLKITALL